MLFLLFADLSGYQSEEVFNQFCIGPGSTIPATGGVVLRFVVPTGGKTLDNYSSMKVQQRLSRLRFVLLDIPVNIFS